MSQRRCSLSRLGLSPATAAGAAIPARGVDLVRKHYDKLTGTFILATGPGKGLCFKHDAFQKEWWQGNAMLPTSEKNKV